MRKTQCNSARRRLDSRAYTMAEMLLVVGLLAILLGVGAVGASQMMRQGRQASLDKMAETLYIAVQRNLTNAKLSGTEIPLDIKTIEEANPEYTVKRFRYQRIPGTLRLKQEKTPVYQLRHSATTADDEETENFSKIEQVIMPPNSLSDELRGGNWIITFDANAHTNSYSVLDVYFSQNAPAQNDYFENVSFDRLGLNDVGNTPDEADENNTSTLKNPQVRLNDGALIGYYGGNGMNDVAPPVIPDPIVPTAPLAENTTPASGSIQETPGYNPMGNSPEGTTPESTENPDPSNPSVPGGEGSEAPTGTPAPVKDPTNQSTPTTDGNPVVDDGNNPSGNPVINDGDDPNADDPLDDLLTPEETVTRETPVNTPNAENKETNTSKRLYFWIGFSQDDSGQVSIANREKLVTYLNCWVPPNSAFTDGTGPMDVNFTLTVRGVSSQKTQKFEYRMSKFGFYSAKNAVSGIYTNFVSGDYICQIYTLNGDKGWLYRYPVVLDSLLDEGNEKRLDLDQPFKTRFRNFIPGEDIMLQFEVGVDDEIKHAAMENTYKAYQQEQEEGTLSTEVAQYIPAPPAGAVQENGEITYDWLWADSTNGAYDWLWKVHMPGWNEYPVCNSLFANAGTVDETDSTSYISPVGSDGVYVAKIEYGRHLQNLDAGISNVAEKLSGIKAYTKYPRPATVIRAEQTRNIDFDAENEESYGFWNDVYGGDYHTDYHPYTFTPITNEKLIAYDGVDKTIANLQVNVTDGSGINAAYDGVQNGAGLFGTLTGNVTLSNLTLKDPKIVADVAGISVGAFAGKASGDATTTLTLQGLTLNSPTLQVQNAENVGGVVGQATARVHATGGLQLNNLTLDNKTRDTSDTTARTIGGVIGLAGANVELSDVVLENPKLVGGTSTTVGGLVGKSEAPLADGNQVTISSGRLYMSPESYNNLKLDAVLDKWLVGGQYAGGLIGYAEGNVAIDGGTDEPKNPSFAATVVNATAPGEVSNKPNEDKSTYAGGLAGYVKGKLEVDYAWADCYVKANTKEGETGTAAYIGGLAGHCRDDSTFTHCYAAGFLVSNTRTFDAIPETDPDRQTKIAQELNKEENKQPLTVAGFAPCEVASISDAYSVFNYDDPTIGITGIVARQYKGQPAVLKLEQKYKLAAEGTTNEAYYAYGGEALSYGIGTSIDRDTLKTKQISGFKPDATDATNNGITSDTTNLYTLFDDELERDGLEPSDPPGTAPRYPYPVLSGVSAHYNDFLVTNPKKLVSVTIDRSREQELGAALSGVTDTDRKNEIVANYLSHSTNAEPDSEDEILEKDKQGDDNTKWHLVTSKTDSRRANGERFVGWFTKEEFFNYKRSLVQSDDVTLTPVQYWTGNGDIMYTNSILNTNKPEFSALLGQNSNLIFPKKEDGTEVRELYAVYEHFDPFLVTVENRYYNATRMNAALMGIIIEACRENPESPLKDIVLDFYEFDPATNDYKLNTDGNKITLSLSYATAHTGGENDRSYNFKAKYLATASVLPTLEIQAGDTDAQQRLKGIVKGTIPLNLNWNAEIEDGVTLNDLMKAAFAGSHLSQPQSIPVDTTAPEYNPAEAKNYTFVPFGIQVAANQEGSSTVDLLLQKAEYCARFDENGKFLGFCQINPVGTLQKKDTTSETYSITGLPASGDLNQEAVNGYLDSDVTFTKDNVTFGQAEIKLDRKSTYVALYADIPFDLNVALEFGNTKTGENNVFTPGPSEGQQNVWSDPNDLKAALSAAQTALQTNATATVKITGSLGTTVLNNLDQLTFEGFTLNEKLTQSSIILARGTNTTKVYYDRNKNTLSYDFAGGVYKGKADGQTQSFRASNSYYQAPNTAQDAGLASEGQDSGGVFYGQVLSDQDVRIPNGNSDLPGKKTYLPKDTGTANVVSKNGYDFNGWEFYASKHYNPDVTLDDIQRDGNVNGWFATVPAMGLDYVYKTIDGVEFLVDPEKDPETDNRVTVQYEDDPDGDGLSVSATYYVKRNTNDGANIDSYFIICDASGNTVNDIHGQPITLNPDATSKNWTGTQISTDVFYTGDGEYLAFYVGDDGFLYENGTSRKITVLVDASQSAEGTLSEVTINENPVACNIQKIGDTYYYVYADKSGTHEEYALHEIDIVKSAEVTYTLDGQTHPVTLDVNFGNRDDLTKTVEPNTKNDGKLYYAVVTSTEETVTPQESSQDYLAGYVSDYQYVGPGQGNYRFDYVGGEYVWNGWNYDWRWKGNYKIINEGTYQELSRKKGEYDLKYSLTIGYYYQYVGDNQGWYKLTSAPTYEYVGDNEGPYKFTKVNQKQGDYTFDSVEVHVQVDVSNASTDVRVFTDDSIYVYNQTIPVGSEPSDTNTAEAVANREGHHIGSESLYPTATLLTRKLSSYQTSVPMPENKRALQDNQGYLLDGIGNVNQSTRELTPGNPILYGGDTVPEYFQGKETVTWTDDGGTQHTAPKITSDYASLSWDTLSTIPVYRAVLHYDGTKEWVETTLGEAIVTLANLKMPDFDVTAKALWEQKVSVKVRLEIYVQRQTDDWRWNTSAENPDSLHAASGTVTGVTMGINVTDKGADSNYNNDKRKRLYDFYQAYDIGEQKTTDYLPGGTYANMLKNGQYSELMNTFFNMAHLRDSDFDNTGKDYLYKFSDKLAKRGTVKCTQLYVNPGVSELDTSTGDIVYRLYLDRNVVTFRWVDSTGNNASTRSQIYGLYEEPLNNPVSKIYRTFDTAYTWRTKLIDTARSSGTGNYFSSPLTMLGSFAYVSWDTTKVSNPGLYLAPNRQNSTNNQQLIYWKETDSSGTRDKQLRDLALGLLSGYENFATVSTQEVNKLVEQDMFYPNQPTDKYFIPKATADSYWGTNKEENSMQGYLSADHRTGAGFYINDKLSGYHFVGLEPYETYRDNSTVYSAVFDTSKFLDNSTNRYSYTGQALLQGLRNGLTLYNARNWHTITFSDIEYKDTAGNKYDTLVDAYFYGATLTRLPDINADNQANYRPARYGSEYEFGGWFTGRDGTGTQLELTNSRDLLTVLEEENATKYPASSTSPQQNDVPHKWLAGTDSNYNMGDADVTVFAYWKRQNVEVSFDFNYPVSGYDLANAEGNTYHGLSYVALPDTVKIDDGARYTASTLGNPDSLTVAKGRTFKETLTALYPNAQSVAMPAPSKSTNGIYGDHSAATVPTAKVKYLSDQTDANGNILKDANGNALKDLYVNNTGEFFYVYYKWVGWYTLPDNSSMEPTQENLEKYGSPVGENDVVMSAETLYGKWDAVAGKTDYYVDCYLDTQDGETEDIVKIHLYEDIGKTGTMSPPLPEKADAETDPVIAAQYRRLEGYYPVSDLIPYEITPGYEFKFHYVKGDRWQYRVRENVTFKNADGIPLTFSDGSTLTLVTRNETAATMSAKILLSANLNGYRLTGYRTNDVSVQNVTLYKKTGQDTSNPPKDIFEVYAYTPGQIAAGATGGTSSTIPAEPPIVSRPNNGNPDTVEDNPFTFQGSDGADIVGKRVTVTETGKIIDFDYEIRYDEAPVVADVAYMTGSADDYLTPLRRGSGIPTPVAAYVGNDFYYTKLTLTYTHKDEGGTDYTVTQDAGYDRDKGLSVPGEIRLYQGETQATTIAAGTYSVKATLELWKDGTTPALGTWTSPLPDATVHVFN